MRSLRLTLETVTPMFLGGAEQQPELRPASVRGALRFWLRAALGGVIGDNDLSRLRRLESEVFGDTERASPVVARLSQPGFTISTEPLLPHRNVAPARAVHFATTFDLTLLLHRAAPTNVLEIATWSALLWLTLGGIGRRSRRGAGSVRIRKVVSVPTEFSTDLQSCLEAAAGTRPDGNALAKHVGSLVDSCLDAFVAFACASSLHSFAGLARFPVLREDTRIIVWEPCSASLSDYKSVLSPLMTRMSNLRASLGTNFANAFGGVNPRRASPLHVTAHRLKDAWALVLTHLEAEIGDGKIGEPTKVGDFLNSLTPKWQAHPCPPAGGNNP
jgi:CRISPR-associated protein Cmr1